MSRKIRHVKFLIYDIIFYLCYEKCMLLMGEGGVQIGPFKLSLRNGMAKHVSWGKGQLHIFTLRTDLKST